MFLIIRMGFFLGLSEFGCFAPKPEHYWQEHTPHR